MTNTGATVTGCESTGPRRESAAAVDWVKVFDEAPAPFLLLTPDFVIVHANRARLEATATTLEATVGRNLFEVFPLNPDDPGADGLRNLRDSLALTRDTREPQTMAVQKYDIPMPDGTFEERYWSPRNVPILDEHGEVVHLLHRSDDITEYVRERGPGQVESAGESRWRRRAEEVEADLFARMQELQDLNRQLRQARDELAARALHDPLTGLLVRSALLEQVTHALARLDRHRGDVAVLFVDLDGLKQVNDTYGHAAGDALIGCCAQRLRVAVRPSDAVARIGGDEFVVLLDELDEGGGTQQARSVAQRLLEALDAPCTVTPAVTVRASASIGIAVATGSPGDNGSPGARVGADELLSSADTAMYAAKRSGRGRYQVFDEAAHRAVSARQRLEVDLRAALPERRLRLHYQPIVELRSGATSGVEALLRWDHPDGRLRTAAEFIDVAEQAGLLPDIGAWVVGEACRQLATWDVTLGDRAPQRMFLNVSAAELAQPQAPARLVDTVRAVGVDPARLVLEITESEMLDTARTTVAFDVLQRFGCQLAIDDFGTGYSSLSRLAQLPAGFLKVDRSFVRHLHDDQRSGAVISAVLALAGNLRRTVIAEGVEDAASLATLRELGCSYVQGFHLAEPQAADRITELLAGVPVG